DAALRIVTGRSQLVVVRLADVAVASPGPLVRCPPELLGDVACFAAAETLEHRQLALEVHARRRAGKDHLRGVPGMASDVALRHEAAERLPEHDGPRDAQRIAETHHVVSEGIERPLLA